MNLKLELAILFLLVTALVKAQVEKTDEFVINVKSPLILANHFAKGISHLTIIPGKDKTDYKKALTIHTLSGNNKSGCRKYKEEFLTKKQANEDLGVLLVDNDSCSLSTKIHYAQLAGASALFLKYLDDNVEEAEIDKSSFEGVRIPIFMLRNTDAQYIYDVLNSSGEAGKLSVELEHKTLIDSSARSIQVYMSSQPINNPMINFLKELKEHERLIKGYTIDIKFSIGFCKSCQEKQFLRQEPSCLSGGRYCVVSSEFRSNELVRETLRQICIRNGYGVDKLINYLYDLKVETESLYSSQKFKEKEMENLSRAVMQTAGIEPLRINNCVEASFTKQADQTKADPNLDDNTLLQKEQQDFFGITKYNIFPLIIINGVYYDRSINIREFIRFGCTNGMFDCRGFRTFKRIFAVTVGVVSLVLILIVIAFCRRVMKKKMDNELNIKVNEAISKYLTVDKV